MSRLTTLSMASLALLGCGDNGALAPITCEPPAYDWSRETDPDRAARWACQYKANDTVETTLGGARDSILGLRNRVRHVFVLMLENRSFDHYLGALGEMDDSGAALLDADASKTSTNPDASGSPVSQYEASHFCLGDVPHEWTPAHVQYDNGLNDGFFAMGGKRALAYYGRKQLPFHYHLAENFAISDRHFSSVMGPTWPNRLFFWTGQSCGYAEDVATNPGVLDCGRAPNIFKTLGDRIEVYDDSGPAAVGTLTGVYPHFPKSMSDFNEAVDRETETTTSLPPVVMLGAITTSFPLLKRDQSDDHAAVDVRLGQQFIFDIVETITKNKALWQSSVLFITYDENGGFYDHVPPPPACAPNESIEPDVPRFDRRGFRVPLYVVSPFVIRKHVSHYATDHTSILRFIETWLDLGALTSRDANAWPLLDFFDFGNPNYDVPAFDRTKISHAPDELADCVSHPKGFEE